MTDERLAELQEIYKDQNLLEELAWGAYADHSGYTYKQDGEFLNWLCLMAYKALKERPTGEWIIKPHSMIMRCSLCGNEETAKDIGIVDPNKHFCSNCGADMRKEEL